MGNEKIELAIETVRHLKLVLAYSGTAANENRQLKVRISNMQATVNKLLDEIQRLKSPVHGKSDTPAKVDSSVSQSDVSDPRCNPIGQQGETHFGSEYSSAPQV